MALQSSFGGFYFPEEPNAFIVGINPIFSNTLVDAITEGIACIVRIPSTGPISEVAFNVNSLGIAGSVMVRVETVTAGGVPSGTLWHTATTAEASIVAATVHSSIQVLLGSAAFVHLGSMVAFTVINTSQFSASTANVQLARGFSTDISNASYVAQNVGAAWAAAAISPVMALMYSDSSYAVIQHTWPFYSIGSVLYSTNSMLALRVSVPFSCRVNGAWFQQDMDSNSFINLYGADGSTKLISESLLSANRGSGQQTPSEIRFLTQTTLAINSVYYLALSSITTTSNQTYWFNTTNRSAMHAFTGGSGIYMSIATAAPINTGSWVDFTTRRPFMGLIIDQLDDGVQTAGTVQNNIFIMDD